MNEPLAFINGQLLPASQAVIPVYDAGFVLGATIAEQLRTFHGKLFRLDEHLDRLLRSLAIVEIDPGLSKVELSDIAERLTSHHYPLIAADDDLGLSIFVTPGPYGTFVKSDHSGPLVGMHTYLQPFHLWADRYDRGQSLVITDVKQVPSDCWPAQLKCRSRMHYYLADLRARQVEDGARALLLDHDGKVTEASTANLVVYRQGEGLVAPPVEKTLPGISLSVLAELAVSLDIPFSHRDLLPDDVTDSDEAILCSTSPCLLPVTRCNGRLVGNGSPGRIFRRVLAAWSEMVGLDIKSQAQRFAHR